MKEANEISVGDKVVCDHMADKWAIPAGMTGTVTFIDDSGTVHVRWENGSGLGLIPGVDRFHKIEQ